MTALASGTYGAAALAFGLVAGILALGLGGGRRDLLLILALLASTVWAVVTMTANLEGAGSPRGHTLAEALRHAGWLVFLGGQLWPVVGRFSLRILFGLGGAVVLAELAVTGLAPFLGGEWIQLAYRGSGAAAALVSLVLVEQACRSADAEGRIALKYLCMGVGGLFAYDLLVYSHALLFGGVDPALWAARGGVNALGAALIAITAIRNPYPFPEVYLSRRFVLYTAGLVMAGLYLLVMVGLSYSLRPYGGLWGPPLQVIFLAGAVLVLLVLVVSDRFRAQIWVFLSKNFFRYRYDYWEEWRRFARTLSAGADQAPLRERVIRAVAQVVESPGGSSTRCGRMPWFPPLAGIFPIPARWRSPSTDPWPASLRSRAGS